jgi:HPt (histidine-containing phosphotransfer) domain-containing protein
MQNRRLLEALLNGVRRQLVEDLDRLVRAVGDNDRAAAQRAAQAMHELAGAVSADALSSAAEQLVTMAQRGSLDAVESHLQSLRTETERCIAYIPVVVNGIKLPTDRK